MLYQYEDWIAGLKATLNGNSMIHVEDTDTNTVQLVYIPRYSKRQAIKYCRALIQSLAKEKLNDHTRNEWT